MTFRKKDVGERWRNILKSDGLYLCDLKRVYYKNVNFVSLKIQIILIRSLIFQSKLYIGGWIFYIKITDKIFNICVKTALEKIKIINIEVSIPYEIKMI